MLGQVEASNRCELSRLQAESEVKQKVVAVVSKTDQGVSEQHIVEVIAEN